MNTSFERSKKTTNEWYTPPEIINSLGRFDLDPAAPEETWYTAEKCYTKKQDGLRQEWFGRVWLNPPYSNPDIREFMEKMAEHGNGIALVFNRCDSAWIHSFVFEKADAMLFLRKRIKFYRPDGTQGGSPGCGSILVAYGKQNVATLESCDIDGKLVYLTNKYTNESKKNNT